MQVCRNQSRSPSRALYILSKYSNVLYLTVREDLMTSIFKYKYFSNIITRPICADLCSTINCSEKNVLRACMAAIIPLVAHRYNFICISRSIIFRKYELSQQQVLYDRLNPSISKVCWANGKMCVCVFIKCTNRYFVILLHKCISQPEWQTCHPKTILVTRATLQINSSWKQMLFLQNCDILLFFIFSSIHSVHWWYKHKYISE